MFVRLRIHVLADFAYVHISTYMFVRLSLFAL